MADVPFFFADEFFESREFLGRDVAAVEEVAHHFGDVALEEPLGEVGDHGAANVFAFEERTVDVDASLGAVGDVSGGFHFCEHGADGGVGEFSPGGECVADLADGGVALVPEDLDDGELEVRQPGVAGHGGAFGLCPTEVGVSLLLG